MDLVDATSRVFENNFRVVQKDKVLVLVDEIASFESPSEGEVEKRERLLTIAEAFYEAAKGKGLEAHLIRYTATGSHGKEPPVQVWEAVWGKDAVGLLKSKGLFEAILEKRIEDIEGLYRILEPFTKRLPTCVVALSNYSTSHTIFRKLLTKAGVRYASMPLFEEQMLTGSVLVSPDKLRSITLPLAQLLSEAVECRITTKDGTELTMSLEGREALADIGDLSFPGAFSNLPAGEAFIAPVEGTASGQMVIHWAPTKRLEKPVVIHIEDGLAVDVRGDDPHVSELLSAFEGIENARNVAELGIGTNPKASKPDNILEAEKILGTIHVAFGDNHTFGGRTKASFHQDYVVFSPTVELRIGEIWQTIMQDGNLLI